jgi:AcrR family transcriptional regulator
MSFERPTSRQDQRKMTRRRITDAARECFYEQGVAETSVEEIARRAGVGRATLYLHFANKDAILLDLIASNMRGVRQIYAELCDARRVDAAVVRAWLQDYIAALRRHREAMPLFHLGLATDAGARQHLDDNREALAEMLRARFPALTSDDPRLPVRLALGIERIDQFARAAAEDTPRYDVELGLDLVAEEIAALLADQPA